MESRTFLSVSGAFGVVLILSLFPIASAGQTIFSDDFENASFPGWVRDSAFVQSCGHGGSQGCVVSIASTFPPKSMCRDFNIPIDSLAVVNFDFKGTTGSRWNTNDIDFQVYHDAGSYVTLALTDGLSGWNTGVKFGAGTGFTSWTENIWYGAGIVFQPGVTMRAHGHFGGVNSQFDPVPGATKITKICIADFEYSAAPGVAHLLDNVRIITYGPPTAPQNLQTQNGVDQIALTWNAPADDHGDAITNYVIDRSLSSASGPWTWLSTIGTNTSYVDATLDDDTSAWYRVLALNAIASGPYSNVAAGATADEPSAPRNLVVSAGPANGQLHLIWEVPSDLGNVALGEYRIYRGTSDADLVQVATVGPSTLSWDDTGLPNNATRLYRVAGQNVAGEGPKSNSATGTTYAIPYPPRSVTSSQGTAVGSVTTTWQAPLVNGGTSVTGYNIYRGTSPGSLTLLRSVSGTTLTNTDTQLANDGTVYHYEITAINGVGESSRSNPASSTPRPDTVTAPAGLSLSVNRLWTGDPTTVSFSYSATVSQCPDAQTCSVPTEWRIYLDGTTGTLSGTLLASGNPSHSAHAQSVNFPISQIVNPSGSDGSHKIKVAVSPRQGSSTWQFAEVSITIDAPLPPYISTPAAPTFSKNPIWPGETITISSSYRVMQKLCKSSVSCPVVNEWEMRIGGTSGQRDGTLLTSGSNSHPAHGENTSYSLSPSVRIDSLTSGANRVQVFARESANGPWLSSESTLTINTPTYSSNGPILVLAQPALAVSGPANVSFRYDVTAMRCTSAISCPTNSEWRILIANTDQNGPLPLGTHPEGTLKVSGTREHPSHGSTETFNAWGEVNFPGTGTYKIKVATRAHEGDTAQPWIVRMTNVTRLSPDDLDQDAVPDGLESILCASGAVELTLETLSGRGGTCDAPGEYSPPGNRTSLVIPGEPQFGPDNDNDTFPQYAFVGTTRVWINISGPNTVFEPGPVINETIDANDSNSNVPVQSVICPLIESPVGEVTVTDSDGDGIPNSVIVGRGTICFDRTSPNIVNMTPSGTALTLPIDPQPNDPNQPVQQSVTVSIPIGADYGPDNDRDYIPGYLYVKYLNVTYNRTRPDDVSNRTEYTQRETLDPNDNDRNNPVVFLENDQDGDLVVDGAEPFFCLVEFRTGPTADLDGSCGTTTDYTPPSWLTMIFEAIRDFGEL